VRLSRKCVRAGRGAARADAGERVRGARAGSSGGGGGELVLVKLQEVVGRADQAPFGPNGGPASSVKAVSATVELGVGEHRLDKLVSLSVELAAVVVSSTRRMNAQRPPSHPGRGGLRRLESVGSTP
jgi:hypothetical protein